MTEKIPGGQLTRKGSGEKFYFVGDVVEVLVSNKDTSGEYALVEMEFQPGSGAPPHTHDHEDEFFRVIDGEFDFHIGEQVIRAKTGDIVVAHRGDVRHFFVNPLERTGRLQVGFVPGNFLDFFREMGAPLEAGPQPLDAPRMTAVAAKYGVTIFPPS